MSVETLRDAHARARPDFAEIFDEGTRAIGEEVRRLKRIVDEFSRFARLPAPERTPVAPDELVQSVLALFPAPPEGVTVARELEPGLPPCSPIAIRSLQVLLNLVRNALDAMPSGGTLGLRARRAGARGGVLGVRHRAGHPPGGPAARVRALLHDEGGRNRPRPRDRAAHRRGARRGARAFVGAGRGHDVHADAARRRVAPRGASSRG